MGGWQWPVCGGGKPSEDEQDLHLEAYIRTLQFRVLLQVRAPLRAIVNASLMIQPTERSSRRPLLKQISTTSGNFKRVGASVPERCRQTRVTSRPGPGPPAIPEEREREWSRPLTIKWTIVILSYPRASLDQCQPL
jgi:hypothetical protein